MRHFESNSIGVLLDEYLELSNYYQTQLDNCIKDLNKIPSKLSILIDRLEDTAFDRDSEIEIISNNDAKGQNIVPTEDTLAAMGDYQKDILKRLKLMDHETPRNIRLLTKWLEREPLQFASGFASFTFAWDKLVDISRLTLVPDPRLLKIRDNVSMATVEFKRFIDKLYKLRTNASSNRDTLATLDELVSSFEENHTNVSNDTTKKLKTLILSNGLKIEDDFYSVEKYSKLAQEYTRNMSLLGLEVGFNHWYLSEFDKIKPNKEIIKSFIYSSKILLEEKSWRKADSFIEFALKIITAMNNHCNIDPNTGHAMLRFNQCWAKYQLGVLDENKLESWDLTGLHPRYEFLKLILLRKFDDALRVLKKILPSRANGYIGNMTMHEVDEWPILEDFRDTEQYNSLK